MFNSNRLLLTLIASVLLPMSFGFFIAKFIPEWLLINYPVHAMLESVGTVSALIISALIIIMINNELLPKKYILIACALITMGILDGFHAILYTGVSFVWLHSIATFIGGIFFASIWISESFLEEKNQKILVFFSIIFSIIIGIVSISMPQILPSMVINGDFTLFATLANILGGIGFIIGASYFIFEYRQANYNSDEISANKNIVFANHCLLFGIAGLLFESSILWDASWWWWHILRFLAYIIVLAYFFSLIKNVNNKLKLNKIQLKKFNHDLEIKVLERTYELQEANKAKSEFLSRMSHELRTPLNAILGFGQLIDIQTNSNNKNQQENIKEILDAGHHLLNLINEILDLSKIETGKIELIIKPINVSDLLEECISLIQPLSQVRHIKIINQTQNDKYQVLADAIRLKQVFLNLLSNAVKYNCENGQIILNNIIVYNNFIQIEVTDTGNGLSKQDISKLFRPFERLNQLSHIEGTGIGLVISKNLIDLMGGSIGIHSTLGEGSTFWIELNLYNSHDKTNNTMNH